MMVNFSLHPCHGQLVTIFIHSYNSAGGKITISIAYCTVAYVLYSIVGARTCMSGRLLTERWKINPSRRPAITYCILLTNITD
jgi:hypothetical protein